MTRGGCIAYYWGMWEQEKKREFRMLVLKLSLLWGTVIVCGVGGAFAAADRKHKQQDCEVACDAVGKRPMVHHEMGCTCLSK